MTIISRYITVAWLRLFAICLSSFVAVYLVLDMMEKIPRFLRAGGAPGDILLFFIWKMPEMIGQTAPFSILMATLLALGLLSRNSEIIAMRSCGISLFRISLPMLTLGLAASLLLLYNAELVVPHSYQKMEFIERIAIKKQEINTVFKRNNIWFRSGNMILQAQLFDPQSRTLKGVVIWTMENAGSPLSRIDAETARFTGNRWLLLRPVIIDFNGIKKSATKKMETMEIALNLKIDDLRVLDNNADNLSYGKLKEYADSLSSGGYQTYRYLTMMHAKLSAPFAAFVMVILGIPFALRNSRSGGIALGVGASIGIGFAYFVVNAILLSYGRSGLLAPLVAAWGANCIFVLGGVWLAMTVRE